MKKKIIILAGTRPEAIKLAPVILQLKKNSDIFETKICTSGQHNEMLYQAFADFDIVPDHDLKVMQPGQSLASVTARLFNAIDSILDSQKPDWVLIQGDTTTVMVAAICSFYRKIKVGHIEAGLRSHNRWAPFPEEINRRISGIVADKHFAPTEEARQNLLKEGVNDNDILVTGNTVVDALKYMIECVRKKPPEMPSPITDAINRGYRLVLITGHRRENFGTAFKQICLAIRDLADAYKDTIFVYPVHLNPMVRQPVMSILKNIGGVLLTEPLSYKPFVWLMDKSTLILTDSGGIQEEAPSLGKPVLVMRDVTERPEGIASGVSRLVGTHRTNIVEAVSAVLNNLDGCNSKEVLNNPYGDGFASQRIIQALYP